MSEITKILTKYWGYSSFRPLQEDIINSVLDGKDTLGLMPTGGGKSITFQVPALLKDGICIVVTPLIALMKDQVDNLTKQGIRAVAIYSGMSNHEIDLSLDNCVYGKYKFLYLSPERLNTDIFRERLRLMNVSLLAIDESHCISQWGYDFRPSYLRIVDIRTILPNVPVLALTATATYKVVDDIQEKLGFKEKNIFRKSFERKNLIYIVRKVENKEDYLLKTIKRIKGTGIVYVRSRKKTKQIAKLLLDNGISADFYNAGVSNEKREIKQINWKRGKTRVIVATNAFGMGIDKSNVRFVVHMDIPNSLEAYYQEAGRGGRDEKTAYAALFYNNEDIENLRKQIKTNFPEIDEIKKVYVALGSYLNITIESSKNASFDFDINEFVNRFRLDLMSTYSSIKVLQKEGYLEYSESVFVPSKIIFITKRNDLYNFQISNSKFDSFIKLLLRTYSGVFTDYARINEAQLARLTNSTEEIIKTYLIELSRKGIINYVPQKQKPSVFFNTEYLDIKNLKISKENYGLRKQTFITKIESVINYSASNNKCRSQLLLEYFGEDDSYRCGNCDVCNRRNELGLSKYEFDVILKEIKEIIQKEESILLNELVNKINYREVKIIKVIQWLFENDKIRQDDNNVLYWK